MREPRGLALGSGKVTKRTWHGWTFPKQSCKGGEHLVELIACNFFKGIAEWELLQKSRDQTGGNRFSFCNQKKEKRERHTKAVLRHWYLPKVSVHAEIHYSKFSWAISNTDTLPDASNSPFSVTCKCQIWTPCTEVFCPECQSQVKHVLLLFFFNFQLKHFSCFLQVYPIIYDFFID